MHALQVTLKAEGSRELSVTVLAGRVSIHLSILLLQLHMVLHVVHEPVKARGKRSPGFSKLVPSSVKVFLAVCWIITTQVICPTLKIPVISGICSLVTDKSNLEAVQLIWRGPAEVNNMSNIHHHKSTFRNCYRRK